MKKLFRLLAAFLLLAADPIAARAQHLGDVSITTISQILFPAGTTCTGSPQVAFINNQGQTSHAITVNFGLSQNANYFLDGSNDGTQFTRMSDTITTVGAPTTLQASGYYTVIRFTIQCAAATGNFTVSYSGSGVPPSQPQGDGLRAQVEKFLFNGVATGNLSSQFTFPPYGNMAGVLFLGSGGTFSGGAQITLRCSYLAGLAAVQTFALSGASPLQFTIAAQPCTVIRWDYTAGTSTGLLQLEYVSSPGFSGAQGIGGAVAVAGTTPSGTAFTGNPVVVGGLTSATDTPAGAAQTATVLAENIASVASAGMYGFAIGAGNINPAGSSTGVTWPNRGPMAVALSALQSQLSTGTTGPVYMSAAAGAPGAASVGATDTSMSTLLATNNGFMQVSAPTTINSTTTQTITTSARIYGTFDGCYFTLQTGAPTGTTPTLDVTIQSASNGVANSFIDRVHFNQVTTVAATQRQTAGISGSPGFNPTNSPGTLAAGARLDGPIGAWLQISYVIGGTTPSFPSVTIGTVCH